MADIELVIKIDEDEYKARQRWVANPRALINAVDKAIANGTVLPKGHGRLIDADKLRERCLYMSNDDTAIEGVEYVTKGMIENADAVIEADREVET